MKNNDHCDFEFCHDCRLARLNELLLADIRRLSVVAVVFLYQNQITGFYNKTQQHHWNFISVIQFNANCVHVHTAAAAAVNKEVADGADVVFTDTG